MLAWQVLSPTEPSPRPSNCLLTRPLNATVLKSGLCEAHTLKTTHQGISQRTHSAGAWPPQLPYTYRKEKTVHRSTQKACREVIRLTAEALLTGKT